MLHRMVKIEASNNASQRTKNRIREHGPFFLFLDQTKSAQCFAGEPAIFVKCHGSDPLISNRNTEWRGWLPESEINFHFFDWREQ